MQTSAGDYLIGGYTYSFGVGGDGALGCEIETDTDAVVVGTAVLGVDTAATVTTSSAIIGDTQTVVHDTSATVETQCGP